MRMDCPVFEWMCVHVAHRLGQCMGHTEGLPVCAHNVNDVIQSLALGPGDLRLDVSSSFPV